MRDLLTKTTTAAMIAGAALFVSACGTNEEATMNNTTYATDDALMDAGTNDVTAIDAATTGADANMSMDSGNMGTDANMSGGSNMSTGNTAMTNGM